MPSLMPPRFQARVDVVPLVLDFLGGLRADDILTELVQNDLDQGATETHIRFSETGLTAEGNGCPVDEKGWDRLTFLLGAGGLVEAKRDGIGAKNHGLRSCFALGDDIIVRSGGLHTQLTLRAGGARARRLDPGALVRPLPDPDAPRTGARIEVSYRTRPLLLQSGVDTGLPVPGQAELERIFSAAVCEAPWRYLGCIRPGAARRYVLTLEHWRLGTCVLTYTCGPLTRKGRLRGFRRQCDVLLPGGHRQIRREEAVLFQPKARPQAGRTPRYYRGPSGFVCEVSWVSGAGGQPIADPGRLRYPISYAADAANARTDLGASFSAPFVSDTARHGVALGLQSQNGPLLEECERALVRLLRDYLVPTYGVAALAVLHDPEHPGSERCARLVREAALAGALPAAPRRAGHGRRGRSGSGPRGRPVVKCVPPRRDGKRSFLIPVYRISDRGAPSPLPELAPQGTAQLHPAVPDFVRDPLLEEVSTSLDGLPYITFDEFDVIARLCGKLDGWFPWADETEWKRDLSDLDQARLYLDALARGLALGTIDEAKAAEVRAHGSLPDQNGHPQPWSVLWRHRHEVPEIPGVQTPRCVHPSLADHPVLRQGRLKMKAFELSDYLARLDFAAAGSGARERFFAWLAANEKHVSGEAMEKLADQPIWPTTAGTYIVFADLCLPEARLRRVLDGHVHQPAATVLSLRRVRTDGRGLLRLRKRPNRAELKSWWEAAVARFPRDQSLRREEARAWHALEQDLVRLRADIQIRAEMPWLGPETLALCGDGRLRAVGGVHLPGPGVEACRLLPRDILEGGPAKLHEALGARSRPSADAVARALAEAPEAETALYPRLAALDAARRTGEVPSQDLSVVPFILVEGRLYPPRRVALRSTRDFWGAWRVPFGADQLATERQNHLKMVGVAGRTPDARRSREFFEWLTLQSESVLKDHLDPVIRHLLHDHGPLSWWAEYPSVPCLPVYAFGHEVKLISRREALSPANQALLPDFPELERQILSRDRRRRIVIASTSGVSDSVFSRLRAQGLRSLRQMASPPMGVRTETFGIRSDTLTARLSLVASERFGSDFKKRLQEFHVDREVLRHRWQHEVRSLQEVRVAPGLEACFRIGARDYWLRADGAADAGQGVLWISADAADPAEAFFSALAERIFAPGSPPFLAYALQAAAAAGYEVRFDTPGVRRPAPADEDDGGDAEAPPEDGSSAGGRSSDVRRAHGSRAADSLPNWPAPGPVPENSPASSGPGSAGVRRRRSAGRPDSPEERAAVDELKERHYAWHCQVCLASHTPAELAPPGSYAYRPLHRRAFVVGHHVDSVQGGGARWVSNILILCEYHHRLLGDRIEHPALSAALHPESVRRVVLQAADGSSAPVEGLIASLELDAEPYHAAVFFTRPHAEAWRGAS